MYKKYILKKGKKIGPYYYDSIRLSNGHVKTVYLGRHPPSSSSSQDIKHSSPPHSPFGGRDSLYVGAVLLFLVAGFFLFSPAAPTFSFETLHLFPENNLLTGRAVSDTPGNETINITNITAPITIGIKNLDLLINETTTYVLTLLEGELQSVTFVGTFDGNGPIDIYWGDTSQSIFSTQGNSKQALLNATCFFCMLNASQNTTVIITLHGAILNLSQFQFEISGLQNLAAQDALLWSSSLSQENTALEPETKKQKTYTYVALKKDHPANDQAPLVIVERPLQIDTELGVRRRLEAPTSERGPDWVRVCENGACVHDLYATPIHIRDNDGSYKLFTDVVKVRKTDGDTFTATWFDNQVNITFEGAPLVQTTIKNKGTKYEWVHWYNYTSVDDIPIAKISSNKAFEKDATGIVVDNVRIGFEDAEEQGFIVTPLDIDSTSQAFALEKDFSQGNVSFGQIIELDPIITLTGANISQDASWRNTTNETSGTGGTTKVFATTIAVRIGIDGCTPDDVARTRSYFDFNLTSVQDNIVVEQTNLTLGIRTLDDADDSTDLNITQMDAWGQEQGNTPGWNDAGGPVYASMNLTPRTSITLTLGATANTQFQNGILVDKFAVGARSSEIGTVPACPTLDNTRALINSSEDNFPPILTIVYFLSPPEITLNAPANNSAFTSVGNIILNATVTDNNDALIREIVFYGTNGTAPPLTDILSIQMNVTNGTFVTYNWTAPVIRNQTDTLLLLHFDNRSLFGENTTLVNDYSNNNYDGTVAGPIFNWTDTILGGAYRFDGTNDNISFGDRDALIGFNKTYLFWIKPISVTGQQTILDKLNDGASTGLRIDASSTDIAIIGDTDTLTATNFLTQNTYTHFALTIDDSGAATVYRDGRLFTTGAFPSISENNIIFYLGETFDGRQVFNGLLDEFAIINRTLSAAEVMNSYRLPSGFYQWYVNASDSYNSNTSVTNVFNLTIPTIPTVILNAPANNSAFTSVGNIILNATVDDANTTDIIKLELYGTNSSTITAENILYRGIRLSPGLTNAYNWTAPQILNQSGLLLLFHLDRNPVFGENATHVYDFTGLGNNGTLAAATAQIGRINETGGKLGGAYVSNGSGALTVNRIAVGDKDQLIGLESSKTYIAWVKPHVLTSTRGILSKFLEPPQPDTPTGFQIIQSGADLRIYADGTVQTISNFFTSLNIFVHMAVVVLTNGTVDIYRDGSYFATTTITSITANDETFFVGRMSTVSTIVDIPFNGTIDEIAIFNRSLTAAEILDTYRLPGGTYFWRGNVTDGEQNQNVSVMRMFTINSAPSISVGPTLTPTTANTTDQFTCAFTVHDNNGITGLSANISFFNNTRLAQSYNISVTGDSQATQTATSGLQAHYENWTCGVTPFDGTTLGNQVNSSAVAVVNSPPSIPVLLHPANNNVTTDTTPFFNWTPSTDPDNDPINYTLNITCLSTAGGSCPTGDDTQTINNINVSNRTLTNDLDFFLDDGFRYNWTVRATDGSNASAFAQPFNLTLVVSIVLGVKVTSSIDFGTLSLGISGDTEEAVMDVPILENQGNSLIVVNLSSNNFLFSTPTAPTSYYQFKVTDSGGQSVVPFNTTESKTSYTNVTVTNNTIALYDFNETAQANVHFFITVPPDEPAGLKSARVLMFAYYRGR